MQAADAGTTGAEGLDSQDGYATPRGAGAAAEVAGGAPRAARAQNASGWGGETAVTTLPVDPWPPMRNPTERQFGRSSQ